MESTRRTSAVRILRLSVSAVCLLVCVLLVGLSVRSYQKSESFTLAGENRVTFMLGYGYVNERFQITDNWNVPIPKYISTADNMVPIPDGVGISIALWQPAVAVAAFAFLPWIQWRFSLRTLLIATALVAVVLGLVVYAAR